MAYRTMVRRISILCILISFTIPGRAEDAPAHGKLPYTDWAHAGSLYILTTPEGATMPATASEDGDCRVWGLKDGCPIAILRGHKGGANMVSNNSEIVWIKFK